MARNLLRFDPFAALNTIQRRFFEDDWLAQLRSGPMPTTDVYTEDDRRMVVESQLPGFAESDVDVSVDDGAIVLHAQKHERTEDGGKKYVVKESSSSFYRRIALPEQADEEHISASFANGTLKVVVPFKELPAPKRVPISSNDDAAA